MLPELTATYNALEIAVVNTPVFGGGLNLRVPGVSASDQLLDFLVIEAPAPTLLRGVAEALVSAFARLGETTTSAPMGLEADEIAEATAATPVAAEGNVWPGVRRIQARAGRIETTTAVDVTLDGEIRAKTPFEVAIARRPLRVLLPRVAQPVPAEVVAGSSAHNSAPGV